MHQFVQDNITEVAQYPTADVVGLGFREPSAISEQALRAPISSINHAEVAKILLAEAGVEVQPRRDSLWYVMEGLPDNAVELATIGAEKRLAFAKELYDYANERLARDKQELPKALAKYAESLGITQTGLEGLFASRLVPIREVRVEDYALSVNPLDYNPGTRGSFNPGDGTLRISAPEFKEDKEKGKDWKSRTDYFLDHELEHVVSFAGVSGHGEVVRFGLSASSTDERDERGRPLYTRHGSLLLDEALQEYILWKGINFSELPSYEASVIVLEMLMGLDPTIEKLCFEAKFLGKNGARGELIGKIEQLLGPLGVEIIEGELIPELYGPDGLREYPDFKDAIVGMLKDDKREKGRALLDQAQLEIFVPRGLGYSDEQLREHKRTDIVFGKPKHKQAKKPE